METVEVKLLELDGRNPVSGRMDTPSYDVIIVGAGPAGLTAATETARAGLKALCLDKLAPGGALINLTELHDFEAGADGPLVASRLADDAMTTRVGIGFREGVKLSRRGPWAGRTARRGPPTRPAGGLANGPAQGRHRPPPEKGSES